MEKISEKELVSIIIPTYNSENTIIKTLNSVINQTYKNIEIIVVDDESSDNTVNLINDIKDKRIHLIKEKNSGPAIARNNGIKESKGDYILFCDSDDWLEEDIIEKLINCEKKYDGKYDVILFKTIRINPYKRNIKENESKLESFEIQDNNSLIESIYNKFLEYNNIFGFDATCGKIISSKLIKGNNIQFPEYIYRFEDGTFCRKVFENANKIYYLNEIGYYYNYSLNSLCNKFDVNAEKIYYEALLALGEGKLEDNNFYIKCITSLTECEKMYFFNKKNKNSFLKNRKEYFEMINKPLFKNALTNIDRATIPIFYKVEILLLKSHLFLIYTILKKTYMKYKKEI